MNTPLALLESAYYTYKATTNFGEDQTTYLFLSSFPSHMSVLIASLDWLYHKGVLHIERQNRRVAPHPHPLVPADYETDYSDPNSA